MTAVPTSRATMDDCSHTDPCSTSSSKKSKSNVADKYQMCMWNAKYDEFVDKCQTVEELDYYLEKGYYALAKCGKCFTEENVQPYTPTEETGICSSETEPCKEKDNMFQYPMCLWDSEEMDEPQTKCLNDAKLEEEQNDKKKVLVQCGECTNTELFVDYFPLPTDVPLSGSKKTKGSNKKVTGKSNKTTRKLKGRMI